MNSVIVVEGIHDEMKIKSVYPEDNIVITNGREIDDSKIELIKKLSVDNDIIVFTDPDAPGERIRNIISDACPSVKHAFLRKKDCISKNKKKVGIEHASNEVIIEALQSLVEPNDENLIAMSDLYELGLNGFKNSALIRDGVSEVLNIGRQMVRLF